MDTKAEVLARLARRAKQNDEPARKVATFLLWIQLGRLKIDICTFFVMDDSVFEDCIAVLRSEREAWRRERKQQSSGGGPQIGSNGNATSELS